MKCNNCGAEIPNNSKKCEYCGTAISLDMVREQEKMRLDGCPKCGSTNRYFRRENQGEVKQKQGKKIVHRTIGVCKDCGNTWYVEEPTTKKKRTWLWILGWLCIFPLPLTILMLRKKEMKPLVKYGIIAVSWILYFIIASTGNSGNDVDSNSSNETVVQEVYNDSSDIDSTENSLENNVDSVKENKLDKNLAGIKDLLGEFGYDNFIKACEDIQIDKNAVSGFKQVDDWASGKRYTFTYGNIGFTVYMLESGYVSGINTGSYHIYEDGYTPLNANDFIMDYSILAKLQLSAEKAVKECLNYPDTADFNWFTTGTYSRIGNYYILQAELTAKNAFNVKDTLAFRADYIVTNENITLQYLTLDGQTCFGYENIPEFERKATSSAIKSESLNGIILTEGQQGEYGEWNEKYSYYRYYVPAGKYQVKCINKGMVFVDNPDDPDNDIDIIQFSESGQTASTEVPEGCYIQLMVNTSIELIPEE